MAKDAMVKGRKKNTFDKIIPDQKPVKAKKEDYETTMHTTLRPLKGGTTKRTMGDNIKKKATEGKVTNAVNKVSK